MVRSTESSQVADRVTSLIVLTGLVKIEVWKSGVAEERMPFTYQRFACPPELRLVKETVSPAQTRVSEAINAAVTAGPAAMVVESVVTHPMEEVTVRT